MNYLYAGLLPSINFGDYIIEYATSKFLSENLPKDDKLIHFHSKDNKPISYDADKLIIPGCTQLTVGQHKSLNHIEKNKIKSYCLAGSLWYKDYKPGFLIRKRIFGRSDLNPDLTIVDKLDGIIGCRDYFTYSFLKTKGYNCLYTGCPTIFISDRVDRQQGGYILFSFGRHNYQQQIYYANKIKNKSNLPLVGIVHEQGDYARIRAAGWKYPLIDFLGDVELYLSYFKNANYVISGRLHGALPALSYGKKVLYFGTTDTRTSVLSDLGVKIHNYQAIPDFEKYAAPLPESGILDYFNETY